MLRRDLLGAVVAGAATALLPGGALARGRTPCGERLTLHAPWPLASVDPHRLDDAAAAFFGDSLFDTLYARDADGAFVPSLAEGEPEVDATGLRVTVRAELRFASGARLDARAVAASLARARARDASAWLADVPVPRVDGATLVFASHDARHLVRALASPLVAVVSPRFAPEHPDGSGPLRAEVQAGGLLLSRNGAAPAGPAFLDVVDVRRALDLETSLRAFESGADDVGWLGSFLHEPRAGARTFDAGAVAWALLRTGHDAGGADAPGVAQALCDGVPHASLASLVVGPPWSQGDARWSGPPADLLVRDDSPWLVELARALSVALSSPSHEVKCVPSAPAEIVTRRASRAYTLMVDLARPAGPGPLGVLVGLAAADDPAAAAALVRHPPRGDVPARSATRTARVGVIGEVRLQGGRAPDVALPASTWGRGVDWGSASRARRAI